MYYPYLRGRQFELISLREALSYNILSEKIIPIIEPVKVSSTLITTIKAFSDKKQPLIIIKNPSVGTFEQEISLRKDFLELYEEICSSMFIKKAYILNRNIKLAQNEGYYICDDTEQIDELNKINSNYENQTVIIPDNSSFRRRINNKIRKVVLQDCFNKKNRNIDYKDNKDEFFNDMHLVYNDEGYNGFSDYSIIGKDYNESGFAPYAVAIHMVYFSDDKSLRVHHFVSKSNPNSTVDTAGKFKEAAVELLNFSPLKNNPTRAYKVIEQLVDDEKFPGLGVIKKLSIMHHIELMNNFLLGK